MLRQMSVLITSASLLGACAVGPDYRPPATPKAAAAPFQAATPAVSAAAPEDRWWALYHDPVLDRLVADALAANTDIRVAVARLERARAALRAGKADRLPQTTLGASADYGRASLASTLPGYSRQTWTYDGGISLAYEADLFGRVSRGVEAARADASAAAADAASVRLQVAADTVRAYLDAITSAERMAVARQTVALLDSSIRITSARFEVGRSDRLDVIRVTALRDQQAATIPTLEADHEAALLRLATLTGRAPADLPADIARQQATPGLAAPIPVGDGRQLLARRPDVRAAERRLAAASARIGIATADLYPRITLGGSAGATALSGMDVLGAGAARWAVGPAISWAFPNFAAVHARIGAARADDAAALASFDGTVLNALEETERALSAYGHALEREETLGAARDAAARAARISLARQREGRIDFLDLLDAQRTLASAEADLVAARRARAFAQVDVFRALGGGWNAS
ncbi:MAG TPA: TolC family protein [Novosphingobium sp.]|nr:TolC family protein [Novosphingobium sp.]